MNTEALEQLKGEAKKERNTATVARHTKTWLALTQEADRLKTDTILAYQTQSCSERE